MTIGSDMQTLYRRAVARLSASRSRNVRRHAVRIVETEDSLEHFRWCIYSPMAEIVSWTATVLGEIDDAAEGGVTAPANTNTNNSTTRTAYIGQMSVTARHPYILYGACAGLVSQHRTLTGAERADRRRSAGCRAQGGYSDASIYEYIDGEWTVAAFVGGGA